MNTRQRKTLERIFAEPTPVEIDWDDIESLLAALGATLAKGSGSRLRITLNGEHLHVHTPHPKRVSTRTMIRAIRDFLRQAGVNP
jgi:hypothetical protein